MPYGIAKVDQLTFTNAGVDQTISVSGIVAAISGNITATGTISGNVILGGTIISGATITGTAGQFGTITGNTVGFTTVTGTTVTGTTANFVSGVFTEQISGATVRGTTVSGTTVRGTTVSGTTVTGATAQFTTITGNTAGFTTVTGTTVTGTTVSDTAGNVRAIPQNSQGSSYTLVAADLGKHISISTGGVTVPASIFSVGAAISIYNNSGSNQTITEGASVTLRQAGTANTGNRTLAQYGVATILCVSSNTFVISGAGLT